MQILTNIKNFFTNVKAMTMPLSQLGKAWDMGMNLFGQNNRNGGPTRPYSQVDWVWICVNLLIDVASSIQLMISTVDDEVVESGPAYDFLFNNPDFKFIDIFEQTVGFYALFREVYWIILESNDLTPTKILVAGPQQCQPVIENGVLTGYKLQVGHKTIPLYEEDVHVIKNFNPHDPHRGLGPLTAGKLSISSSYQATQYSEATLANGARISTVLTTPQGVKLDDDERKALKAQFESSHKGARNAGKTFLATGGVDVKNLSQTMADLQMIDLRKYDAATICALLGTPGEIVGLNSEAQYAHGPASQRYVMYTITPMLSTLADHIDEFFLKPFARAKHINETNTSPVNRSKRFCGSRQPLRSRKFYRDTKKKAVTGNKRLFAWFDIDSHPAIQEMLQDRAEKSLAFVKHGVPLNQVIDANDLPYDTSKIPWGDEHLVPAGLVPASWIIEAGPESMTEPSLPEGGDEPEEEQEDSFTSDIQTKANAQQKLRIWRKWVTSWAGIEKEYKAAIRLHFVRQQNILIKKLKKALPEEKTITTKETDQIIHRVVFDIRLENNKFKVINQSFFEKAAALGVAQTISEIAGLAGDDLKAAVNRVKLSPAMKRSLAISSHKIQKVNATTQNMVARQLRSGLEKGEGLADLSKRIKAVLGNSRARSLSIARTQTAGAVSTGRHAGMKEAGVELKSWLSSRDDGVRPAHKAAEENYKDGILLSQPFEVAGESLMYPTDPNGSAANIINCRCLQIARKVKGKTIDLGFYDNIEFITYTESKSLLSEV
jgi:HK97 family phage portal protein